MRLVGVLVVPMMACVSPTFDKTPTVTSATVTPTTVPKNADGSYSFSVKFSYNDEDNVESYLFVAGAVSVPGNLPTPQHIGTTNFNVNLGVGYPAGSLSYTLTITDSAERTSDGTTGTIILSP